MAAHKLFFTEIKGKNEKITFTFYPGARINAAKIPEFLSNYKKKMSFTAVGVPYFTYKYEKTGIIDKDAENLLKDTEDILEKMQILLETAEG